MEGRMKIMQSFKTYEIINQASFAMDDVKLFLDTHPSCSECD